MRITNQGFQEPRATAFKVFHESWLFCPFGSPWVRRGRATETRRPDRRTVNDPLTTIAAMTTKIPQMCTKSRIPQKNHCWPARFCPRWSDMARWLGVSWCPRTVSVSRPSSPRAPLAGKSHKNAQNPGSPRKMRQAQRSTQLSSPSRPLPLRRMPNAPML